MKDLIKTKKTEKTIGKNICKSDKVLNFITYKKNSTFMEKMLFQKQPKDLNEHLTKEDSSGANMVMKRCATREMKTKPLTCYNYISIRIAKVTFLRQQLILVQSNRYSHTLQVVRQAVFAIFKNSLAVSTSKRQLLLSSSHYNPRQTPQNSENLFHRKLIM